MRSGDIRCTLFHTMPGRVELLVNRPLSECMAYARARKWVYPRDQYRLLILNGPLTRTFLRGTKPHHRLETLEIRRNG